MKKAKFEGKLSLNKETVAKLNEAQMKNLHGGTGNAGTCAVSCVCTGGPTGCPISINDTLCCSPTATCG